MITKQEIIAVIDQLYGLGLITKAKWKNALESVDEILSEMVDSEIYS